jgi:hypothetical protein
MKYTLQLVCSPRIDQSMSLHQVSFAKTRVDGVPLQQMLISLGVPAGSNVQPLQVACDMMTVMQHRASLYTIIYNDWLDKLESAKYAKTLANIAQLFLEWLSSPLDPRRYLHRVLNDIPFDKGS